jgi:copper chaperone CopZ
MKKRIYILNILLVAAFLNFIPGAIQASENQNKIIEMQKDTTNQKVVCYEVFGMDCPGCQSALEKQVKKIDGVATAKASFKEKQVVIELKPGAKVSDAEIEKRIKKANFTPGKKIESSKDEK